MPTIIVYMSDRPLEEKRALVENLTEGTVKALGVRPDQVQIHMMANNLENMGKAGKLRSEMK